MKSYHRPFDSARDDFEKMWRFLQGAKYIPTFFQHHAELWLDAFDGLLGSC